MSKEGEIEEVEGRRTEKAYTETSPELQMLLKQKTSPLKKANLISRLFTSWPRIYVQVSKTTPWQQSMHFPLSEQDQVAEIKQKFTHHHKNTKSISGAIWRCFRYQLITILLIIILNIALTFSTAFFLADIVQTIEDDSRSIKDSTDRIILNFVAILLVNLIAPVLKAYLRFKIDRISLQTKSAVLHLLTEKILKFSSFNHPEHSEGNLINYAQVDTQKLEKYVGQFFGVLQMLLTMITGFVVIYYMIGNALIGMVVVAVVMNGFYGIIYTYRGRMQKALLRFKDERFVYLKEVLGSLEFVKLSVLENFYCYKVFVRRAKEIRKLRQIAIISGFGFVVEWMTPGLTQVYEVLKLATMNLNIFLNTYVEMVVSVRRLNSFLNAPELTPQKRDLERNDGFGAGDVVIEVRDGNFKWGEIEKDQNGAKKATGGTKNQKNQKKSKKKKNKAKVESEPQETEFEFGDTINKHEQSQQVGGMDSQFIPETGGSGTSPESGFRLKNLNFSIKRGEMVFVVGKSSAGKSSLLYSILGEMTNLTPEKTRVESKGKIMLLGQDPWTIGDTAKANILLGAEYDEDRLEDSIRMAQMEHDIQFLTNGLETILGDTGHTVSGGQRARLGLARCFYQQPDIFLLDDPLSALDLEVASRLLRTISESPSLEKKTFLFCTNNPSYLKFGDRILYLRSGGIEFNGTFEEFKTSGLAQKEFPEHFKDGELVEADPEERKTMRRMTELLDEQHLEDLKSQSGGSMRGSLINRLSRLSKANSNRNSARAASRGQNSLRISNRSPQKVELGDVKEEGVEEEEQPLAPQKEALGPEDGDEDQSNDLKEFLLNPEDHPKNLAKLDKNDAEDNQPEQETHQEPQNDTQQPREPSKTDQTAQNQFLAEDRETGNVGFEVILRMIEALGGWPIALLILFMTIFAMSFVVIFVLVTVEWGEEFKQGKDTLGTVELILGMSVAAAFATALRALIYLNRGALVSSRVHARMLFNVTHSSLADYLQRTPFGQLLNRFSYDIDLIDKRVFFLIGYVSLLFFLVIVDIIAVLIGSENLFLIVPCLVLFVVGGWYRKRYMRAKIEIMRLYSITRSPLTGWAESVIKGSPVLRAVQKQQFCVAKMDRYIDENMKNGLVSLGLDCWFVTRLAIWSWLVVLLPSYGFVIYRFYSLGEGEMVNFQTLLLFVLRTTQLCGDYQNFVSDFSDLEGCLVSLERCKAFEDVDSEVNYTTIEADRVCYEVPKSSLGLGYFDENGHKLAVLKTGLGSFDENGVIGGKDALFREGRIEIRGITARYPSRLKPVLVDISVDILPGERVGIVGRTGAGKSSFIKLFSRLLIPESGSIKIDGKDLSKLDLKTLRSGIGFISQDSTLFEGSLLENIDPCLITGQNRSNDLEELKAILVNLGLSSNKEFRRGGLLMHLESGGANLSEGERQVVSFVRAVYKRRKVMIFDEATSNLDLRTEERLQKVMDERLKGCTVLVIAHRLQTVLDCDKIMVFDDGRLVEFDSPAVLRATPGSIFARLCENM